MSVEEQRERARQWAAENLGVGRTNIGAIRSINIPRNNIAHEREMDYERNINREMDLKQNQDTQMVDETNTGHYNRMHDIVMRLGIRNVGNSEGGRNKKKTRKSKKCKRRSSRRYSRKKNSKRYK
jgi:hypothetical protein